MSIGERLKAAREAKKITLEDAARVTKIQRQSLEAIEADRLEETMSAVYVRIFLKKYASYLGLDGAVLLDEYQSFEVIGPEPALTVQTEVTRRQKEEAGSPWWIPVSAGLLALVGVGCLAYLSMDLYSKLTAQPPERHEIKRAGAVAERPAPAPAREWVVPPAKDLKLSVQTTADVWLQVKSDGAVIFQNVLSKGAQEGWTAKRELELWTGNAGAMRLSLNGKPLDGFGRGVKKGIRITHAGLEQ